MNEIRHLQLLPGMHAMNPWRTMLLIKNFPVNRKLSSVEDWAYFSVCGNVFSPVECQASQTNKNNLISTKNSSAQMIWSRTILLTDDTYFHLLCSAFEFVTVNKSTIFEIQFINLLCYSFIKAIIHMYTVISKAINK